MRPDTFTRYLVATCWLVAAFALAAACYRINQLTEAFRAPITQQSTSAN